MKANNIFFTTTGFFSGIVAGASMVALLSFTYDPGTPVVPGGGIVPITLTEAIGYFKNFQKDAAPLNQVVKGFTIDKTQLDAMNSLAKESTTLTGFRIYMGKDNNSRKIGIVVGIDNTGKDAVKNTIFNTDSQSLSPCPPICDVNSPITLNN